jgi:hypothetical protein
MATVEIRGKCVELYLGLFVLLCIDDHWPPASTLREARNLFPDSCDLEDYVTTMYEIFKKEPVC